MVSAQPLPLAEPSKQGTRMALALLASACSGDRDFTVAGYSTCPNYDTRIKTVHVPVFKTIYAPVRQLVAAFSPDNEAGFKKVVVVEDSRRGLVMVPALASTAFIGT
mgnify:CR=1 FL=1